MLKKKTPKTSVISDSLSKFGNRNNKYAETNLNVNSIHFLYNFINHEEEKKE